MFGWKAKHDALKQTTDAREKELLAEIAKTGVLLTTARNDRDVAHRKSAHLKAEAGIIQASFGLMFRVVRSMDMEWGLPAAQLADDLDLDEKAVRTILRALEANGLAKRHPFFSEDTHLINGSGYSLTAAGEKLRTMLPPDPAPLQLPIAA